MLHTHTRNTIHAYIHTYIHKNIHKNKQQKDPTHQGSRAHHPLVVLLANPHSHSLSNHLRPERLFRAQVEAFRDKIVQCFARTRLRHCHDRHLLRFYQGKSMYMHAYIHTFRPSPAKCMGKPNYLHTYIHTYLVCHGDTTCEPQ